MKPNHETPGIGPFGSTRRTPHKPLTVERAVDLVDALQFDQIRAFYDKLFPNGRQNGMTQMGMIEELVMMRFDRTSGQNKAPNTPVAQADELSFEPLEMAEEIRAALFEQALDSE